LSEGNIPVSDGNELTKPVAKCAYNRELPEKGKGKQERKDSSKKESIT
jgi:hypothetical protein